MQRNTQQRDAIRTALERAGRPLSPEEILEHARRLVPALGLATVYRTINALRENNLLATVELPGEPARYEPAGKAHHHHFLCRVCNRLLELPGCPGNLHKLVPSGYETEGHELTFFGQCRDCKRPPRRTPPKRGTRRRTPAAHPKSR